MAECKGFGALVPPPCVTVQISFSINCWEGIGIFNSQVYFEKENKIYIEWHICVLDTNWFYILCSSCHKLLVPWINLLHHFTLCRNIEWQGREGLEGKLVQLLFYFKISCFLFCNIFGEWSSSLLILLILDNELTTSYGCLFHYWADVLLFSEVELMLHFQWKYVVISFE